MQSLAKSEVPIVTGNPDDVPASFTRFVLPFIWSLDRPVTPEGPLVFEPVRDAYAKRSRYFTPETANALFERTRWYRLKDRGSAHRDRVCGGYVLHIGSKKIAIEIAPPQIVLFESEFPETTAEIMRNGFLLVDVQFAEPAKPENAPTLADLLVVNELFRYWRAPYDTHQDDPRTMPDGRAYSFASLLKDLNDASNPYLGRWDRILEIPVRMDDGVRRLTARSVSEQASGGAKGTSKDRGWVAYPDERAFVWTCAVTQNGARDLLGADHSGDPTHSADWVRLLNVDRPSTNDATEFERKWVGQRTYERWKHTGTLYGFNAHSGAMVAAPCADPPICRHFGGVHFDQVLLLLYVRVSLFRFSESLAEITSKIAGSRRKDFAPFRELRRAFTFLTNLYRFPLLSSQQQGIEMYAMARQWLDIDDLFKEVETEVTTTHEMFELTSTSKMADVTAYLTYFILAAGVLATVMAFLAAEDLRSATSEPVLRFLDRLLPWLMPSWWLIALSVPVIVGLCFLAYWRNRH